MVYIDFIAGTCSAIRSYRINRARSRYGPGRPDWKVCSMTILLLALLAAVVVATGIVLADSGLRIWSAFGGIPRQKAALRHNASLPLHRKLTTARVTTAISYGRTGAAPFRVAA